MIAAKRMLSIKHQDIHNTCAKQAKIDIPTTGRLFKIIPGFWTKEFVPHAQSQHLSTLFVNLGCRGLLIARCIFEALPSTIRVLGNMRYPIWKITDLIVFLNKLSLYGQISLHKCWGKVWKMPVDPLQLYYTLFSFQHEQSWLLSDLWGSWIICA